MNQDTSIIALPVFPVAQRSDWHEQLSPAATNVIDLEARRRAVSAGKIPAGIEPRTDDLSPGEVWDALNDDRLVVHYQPQYDMQSGKTVAAEALARLIDVDGNLVYPDRFIDPVEQRDLIVPLGRAIIERACADLAVCRRRGLPLERMAINLSAYQLEADTSLLTFIDRVVTRHGLQHDDLEFELTERQSLNPDCEGQDVLHALVDRGARIVIDDFGVGYSSVIYLAQLPVSAFKLDRSLIAGILEDEPARKLVDSLLALARNMGLEVVAEGVETAAQNDYLVGAGCPFAQGYGYAKPMPVDELRDHVAAENAAVDTPGIGA